MPCPWGEGGERYSIWDGGGYRCEGCWYHVGCDYYKRVVKPEIERARNMAEHDRQTREAAIDRAIRHTNTPHQEIDPALLDKLVARLDKLEWFMELAMSIPEVQERLQQEIAYRIKNAPAYPFPIQGEALGKLKTAQMDLEDLVKRRKQDEEYIATYPNRLKSSLELAVDMLGTSKNNSHWAPRVVLLSQLCHKYGVDISDIISNNDLQEVSQ